MGRGDRGKKAQPVSVALTAPERSAFETEAQRRGLGLSTTIRSLAFERAAEVRQERQRERARRWQLSQLDALIARIESEGIREVPQEQIDAVFAEAAASSRPRARAAAGG